MKGSLLRAIAFWIFFASALPLQMRPQQQPAVSSPYSNDAEGLRKLLENMLAAAKSGDQAQLRSMIHELEIPNSEVWYTKTFGPDKGESWAGPYQKELAANETRFEDLLMKLSSMGGDFAVQKIDTRKRYDTLTGPLDEYVASWKSAAPDGKEHTDLADFFFIDGKFRWNSTDRYFPFEPELKRNVVMGKLVKNVAPVYPVEAQRKRIQGPVKLRVIIRKDGSVIVQTVVQGDPALSPAAIEAVKQWRFEPTLLDGKPIDFITTLEVNFALRP